MMTRIHDDENTPQAGFERQAIAALKKGEKTYEAVVEKDGKRYLRYATPIPVVMDKCVMCHAHYADVPEGKPIGSLSFMLPIE